MTEVFKDSARPETEHKSVERVKQTGEVFTPLELVNEMLDKIPAEMWQPGKTILEPAAGNGNFVVEVLRRKLAAGCTPTQAMNDVYAIEYMADNVKAMKRRIKCLFESHILTDKLKNRGIPFSVVFEKVANRKTNEIVIAGISIKINNVLGMHVKNLIKEHIVCANALDPSDTSEGRCYPKWMPDYREPPASLGDITNTSDIPKRPIVRSKPDDAPPIPGF